METNAPRSVSDVMGNSPVHPSDRIADLLRQLAESQAECERLRVGTRTELIEKMVDAFLGWRLPNTFSPDCGISFDGSWVALEASHGSWPIGTNLFTAIEARHMLEYMFSYADAAAKETGNEG